MRIIGGEYKSRSIAMPRGVEMRPTQDKVREALFNILGDIAGKKVLELFAGSGAFGIEAISRGAASATFVDNNFRCVQTIKSNLGSLGVPDSRYNIMRADALKFPAKVAEACEKYDIIFLDPPYYRDMAKKCLINLDSCDILTQAGFVVAEHFRKDNLIFDMKRLVLEKERRYGDTVISIFRKARAGGQID